MVMRFSRALVAAGIATIAVVGYQAFGPNTAYDRFKAAFKSSRRLHF